jgi:hypothetical protein
MKNLRRLRTKLLPTARPSVDYVNCGSAFHAGLLHRRFQVIAVHPGTRFGHVRYVSHDDDVVRVVGIIIHAAVRDSGSGSARFMGIVTRTPRRVIADLVLNHQSSHTFSNRNPARSERNFRSLPSRGARYYRREGGLLPLVSPSIQAHKSATVILAWTPAQMLGGIARTPIWRRLRQRFFRRRKIRRYEGAADRV